MEMLDISILDYKKVLKTELEIKDFLGQDVVITQKTDGVKLTVLKQDDEFILSYKGNVLFSSEFEYTNVVNAKKSLGASQFKVCEQHFRALDKNTIPNGMEFFIEFLLKKQTLSSNYEKSHQMVLIGYAKSSGVVKFGKLKTSPQKFETKNREKWGKLLRLDTPKVLFSGKLGDLGSFEKNASPELAKKFREQKTYLQTLEGAEYLENLRQIFLEIPSVYGGKEEGVVLMTKNLTLKMQQSYQLDKQARLAIKSKFRGTEEEEKTYWEKVGLHALELVSYLKPYNFGEQKIPELLKLLAQRISVLKLDFSHSVKTETNIKDDIQLQAKTLILKQIRGNNNALVLGKFRVLQKGHVKMIKIAQREHNEVVLCLVSGKDRNKESVALRTEMLRKCFKDLKIINASSGNLITILGKSDININTVYCGSDRVTDYRNQLQKTLGVDVREISRTKDDISATKIIDNIEDEEFFKKNCPKEIHLMYNKIKEFYAKNEEN